MKLFLLIVGVLAGIMLTIFLKRRYESRQRLRVAEETHAALYADSLPIKFSSIDSAKEQDVDLRSFDGPEVSFRVASPEEGFAVLLGVNSGGFYYPMSGIVAVPANKRVIVSSEAGSERFKISPIDQLLGGGGRAFAAVGSKKKKTLQDLIAAHDWNGIPRSVLVRARAAFLP